MVSCVTCCLWQNLHKPQCEDTTPAPNTGQTKQSSKKRARTSGGKAAVPKPFDSDYDSDDKLIIDLKKQGCKDEDISRRFAEEGREQHSAKRVSTRWSRLKKIEERKEEERLDDELGDWHIGEVSIATTKTGESKADDCQDDKLREAFNATQARYEIDLLKLKEKKWKDISAHVAESLGVKKYTPKACKERWESPEDGTALLPIELDPDQEHRRELRENRIAENKRRRAEQKEAAIWALGAKDRKAAEKRAILKQRDEAREAAKAVKQAERDEDERIKAEQRAGIEKKRAEQRAIENAIKTYHENKRNERKNVDAMYLYYTGKKLNGRRDANLIKGADDDDTNYDSNSDANMEGFDFDDDENESDMPDLTDAEEDSAGEFDQAHQFAGRNSGKRHRASRTTPKRAAKSNKTKVTLETLANPRSIMDDAELAEVLARRRLPRRNRGESHAEVVARLAAADASLETTKIKGLLAVYFDRRKGSREVLIRRLQEYDASSSTAGLEGVTADDPEFKAGYEGYSGKFALAQEE